MDSYRNIHPDIHLQTPTSKLWIPNCMIFVKKHDFPQNISDFPETIPAYLNSGYQHIFFLYPRKLSYSSRNAYIRKARVRLLGDASCLLKNMKKRLKTYECFFVTCRPFSNYSIP